MGEIADDMIEGRACALCGQYFEDSKRPGICYEHGYPVACRACWETDCGYERTYVETF